MDALKTWPLQNISRLILLGFCLLMPHSAQAELEYISPEQRKALEQSFASAEVPRAEILQGTWKCDLFGIRSSMQVQRGIELYDWSSSASQTGQWKNAGAQPVNAYRAEGGMVHGVQDRFEDQVKRTRDGHLISQLSVLTPQKMVVAYALCSTVP
jgi:hypothetical protein